MDPTYESKDGNSAWALQMNARYGRTLCNLNARLYGHLNSALTFLAILLSTAAVTGLFTSNAQLAGAAGLLLAIVTVVATVYSPGVRCAEFTAHSRRYAELLADQNELDGPSFARRLATLQGEDIQGEIMALAQPAYNAVLREMGHTAELQQISRWQNFMKAMA